MSKKAKDRLCELASMARGSQDAASHNLAFAFLDMSVNMENVRSKDILSLWAWFRLNCQAALILYYASFDVRRLHMILTDGGGIF